MYSVMLDIISLYIKSYLSAYFFTVGVLSLFGMMDLQKSCKIEIDKLILLYKCSDSIFHFCFAYTKHY